MFRSELSRKDYGWLDRPRQNCRGGEFVHGVRHHGSPQFTIPKWLHGTSMLIYLGHEFVIYALFVVMRFYGLGNSDFMIYALNAVVVIVLSVSGASIMRNKFPNVSRILTGGR